jgi:hypothetical protein
MEITFHRKITLACKNGDIETLQQFFNSPEAKTNKDLSSYSMLLSTISNKKIEAFKLILNSSFRTDELFDVDNTPIFMRSACMHNQSEMFKYLVNHPKVMNFKNNGFLSEACEVSAMYSKIEMFHYLFEHFPEHPGLLAKLSSENFLANLCSAGNLDVLEYIFGNEDIKKHVDIHAADDKAFTQAFEDNHTDILKYFIFKLQIEMTSTIKNLIKSEPLIINMFKLRELNKTLNKDLEIKQINPTNKKLKV